MPHMANLSWIWFFMSFNMALMLVLFSMNFNFMVLPTEKNYSTQNNKKWQW